MFIYSNMIILFIGVIIFGLLSSSVHSECKCLDSENVEHNLLISGEYEAPIPDNTPKASTIHDFNIIIDKCGADPIRITCRKGIDDLDIVFGSIEKIANFKNLEYLLLNEIGVAGSIPDFSNSPKLQEVVIRRTRLGGEIPSLSNLPVLAKLKIEDNPALSGSIPIFSGSVGLTSLELANNTLIGTIPDISNLLSLEFLNLRLNNLIGPAVALDNLKLVNGLLLEGNFFTGLMPESCVPEDCFDTCFDNLGPLEKNSQCGDVDEFDFTPLLLSGGIAIGVIGFIVGVSGIEVGRCFPCCCGSSKSNNEGNKGDIYDNAMNNNEQYITGGHNIQVVSDDTLENAVSNDKKLKVISTLVTIVFSIFDLVTDIYFAFTIFTESGDIADPQLQKELQSLGYLCITFIAAPILYNFTVGSYLLANLISNNDGLREWIKENEVLATVIRLISLISIEVIGVTGIGAWKFTAPLAPSDIYLLRTYAIANNLLEDLPQICITLLYSKKSGAQWLAPQILSFSTSLIALLWTVLFRIQSFQLNNSLSVSDKNANANNTVIYPEQMNMGGYSQQQQQFQYSVRPTLQYQASSHSLQPYPTTMQRQDSYTSTNGPILQRQDSSGTQQLSRQNSYDY